MGMDYPSICVAILLGWTLFHVLRSLTNRRKLPPGPFPLPVIGNLHLLERKRQHQSLARLAAKYGPVMNLKLGTVNAVVISSPVAAREALQANDSSLSSCRPLPDALRGLNYSDNSVVWLPVSPKWRALRKIVHSNLFSAVNLNSNQQLRDRKIHELLLYCQIKSERGERVDIGREAFKTVMNLLSNTIFSKDIISDRSSDSEKTFKDLIWSFMDEAGAFNLVDYFPFLKKLDPQGIRRRATHQLRKIIAVFEDLIDECLEERELSGTKNFDVLDSILNICREVSGEKMDNSLIHFLCLDLFVAGTDTSSSTVEWALSELIKSPETMAKAQAELWGVIGKGKQVKEEDITRLPYLKCIVKETYRLHPPVPLMLPRKVEQELVLCGYTIPKDSHIHVNEWAIGHDPNIWENPLEFKPERFLDSRIEVNGRDFVLTPFSAGRRICPGKPLALRTVPVMLGSLLNSFRWRIESEIAPKDLDMEEAFGITLHKARPLIAIPCAI